MTQNWQHKKEFIFALKSSAPYMVPSPQCDTSQDQFPWFEPEWWIPNHTTQAAANNSAEIDLFRLSYNKVWFRHTQATELGSRYFPGISTVHVIQSQPSLDLLAAQYCSPKLASAGNTSLGLGLVLTTEAPQNLPNSAAFLRDINLKQTRIIPSNWVLRDGYVGYPWNTVDLAAIPSNANFLSGHREKIVMQIAAPLTKYNFDLHTGGDYQAFMDSQYFPVWWKDEDEWRTFIGENFHEKTYYDFTFKMWMPFEDSDINQGEVNYSQSVRDVWTKIDPSYNFYVKSYEEISSLDDIPEALLPNLYVFASEFDNRFEDADNSRFKQLINLTDDSGQEMISGIFTDIKSNGRKVGEKDEGQYFEKWAQVMGDPNTDLSNFDLLIRSYSQLIIPIENLGLLDEHKGDERLFPMNIKLEFVTDIKTQFADALQESNLFFPFLNSLREMVDNEAGIPVEAQWSFKDWENVASEMCEYVNNYASTRTWDLGQWLTQMPHVMATFASLPTGFRSGWQTYIPMLDFLGRHATYLGRVLDEIEPLMNPQNALYIILAIVGFQNKLNDAVKPTRDGGKFRSFKNILQGKEAYSETLVYRIEKLDAADDTTIQSIWLPNSSQIDTLSYIDTQVKYNKKYRYKIWAYQMVIGNKYKYKVNGLGPGSTSGEAGAPVTYNGLPEFLGGFLARLCVFNEPSIRLIEVPYYDTKIDYPDGIAVMDSPPVRPNVNIIPYQNTGDKLLLWLNGNVGDYWEEPITILPDDDFNEMLQYHGRDTNDDDTPDEVHFKSDDHVTQFDIFKLSHRPRRYTDFTEGTHSRIPAAQGSTSADFIDDITPNKKYYYTFRAIDNHDHVSNPSPVYECELVKDNENIYSLIRIIDMDVDMGRQVTKSGRRYLQIKPAFSQVLLNESELALDVKKVVDNQGNWELQKSDGTPVPVTLGNNATGIWGEPSLGRKFKIRLTSKKSSKKLDLNVKFSFNKDRME